MDSHENINKRKSLRKSIQIPVEYRSREDRLQGISIDLSETGISIFTDNCVNVGETLDVGLILDKEQFNSRAIVRHIKDGLENRALGLQFLDLNEKNRNNIRHILNFPFDNNLIDYTSFPYSLNLDQGNHKIIADKNFVSLLLTRVS